jgi:nucleoside-diphosphate-sugar epimerase
VTLSSLQHILLNSQKTAQKITMSKPLVLITGATGHIGFRTLATLLKAGYAARVTSRKLASAEKLKHTESVKPYANDVSFVEIPDVLASGAYDDAVKDVEYILHLASPIPDASLSGNPKKHYVDPAVQGTIRMLESAAKSPSVKRVVVTSSVVVLAPKAPGATIGPSDFADIPNEDDIEDNMWVAYRASKVIAHHKSVEWMEEHKPKFDLVYVLPAYVQGRNELVTRKEDVHNGSNDVMVDLLLGMKGKPPKFANNVFVDDVADVEIAALDQQKVKTGDCLIASPGKGIVWDDVTVLAKKLFPEAVASGVLPLGGEQASITVDYDVSYTERVTGVKFRGLEEQVKSLIGQYVELAGE